MELKLGKMTSRELAQWFGVKYERYSHNISKYLEVLELYCDFEKIYGGVIVKEIFIEQYDKKLNKKDKELYMNEIERCVKEQDGLSTVAGMARKYMSNNEYDDLRTAQRRLGKTGEKLFGKTALKTKGIIGMREYVWAIKLDDYNHYRYMSIEEQQILYQIMETYYTVEPEKILKLALLDESLKNKEIEVDEYFNLKERLNLSSFSECLKQFSMETGWTVVRASRHEIGIEENCWEGQVLVKDYDF